MDALLIIDMQNGCFKTPRYDRAGISERINKVSASFRKEGKPVFFIQHDGTKEEYLFPGSDDFEIIPELVTTKSDYFLTKTVNTAFYKTHLDQILKKLNVDTLFITGMATDFCVNATIHSALVKEYNLVIVKECHTTADRPTLDAKSIIDFHNWLWANLTPTEGRICVKSIDDIV